MAALRALPGPALTAFVLLVALVVAPTASPALTEVWTKYYDGAAHGNDQANDMAVASDGRWYVVGSVTGSDGGQNIFLAKYSPRGKRLWRKTVDSVGEGALNDDVGRAVAVAADGSVYAAGYVANELHGTSLWLGKYSSGGQKLWARKLGRVTSEGYDVAVASDGSVYVTGFVARGAPEDENMWLAKYSPSGTRQWAVEYDHFSYHSTDVGRALGVMPDGGVVVAGSMHEDAIDADHLLLQRYKPDGAISWNRGLYHVGGVHHFPQRIAVGARGAFYISSTVDLSWYTLLATYKFNAAGDYKWQDWYYGEVPGSLDEGGRGITMTPGGDILVAGFTTVSGQGKNVFLRFYSPDGSVLDSVTDAGVGLFNEELAGVAYSPAGGSIYAVGTTGTLLNGTDILLRKYKP